MSAGGGPLRSVFAALAGFRHPIVVILLLTGFFTAITGRPVQGVLVMVVAAGLAWDAVRHRQRPAGPPSAGEVAGAGPAGQVEAAPSPAPPPAPPTAPPAAGRRRPLVTAAWVAGGAVYAGVIGAFPRYSGPATVAVTGLGVAVVAIGWRGPLVPRPDPGKLPARGVTLWAALLVAAGLWELAALFQQPSLTVTSQAHPTISALTDPLLGSPAGRSAALAIWLAIGWFLVER